LDASVRPPLMAWSLPLTPYDPNSANPLATVDETPGANEIEHDVITVGI
jgi:hypothetical protein